MKKHVLKAQAKYNKTHKTGFAVRFSNKNDRAVIDKLNSVENKTDYIRQLILADINK